MKRMFLLLIFLLFLVVSCGETTGDKPVNKGLAGFKVEFAEDYDWLKPEKRFENVKYTKNGVTMDDITAKINVTALGYDNKPLTDYKGEIEISLLYGKAEIIDDVNGNTVRTNLTNGYAGNLEVKMKNCLDNDRVVIEEVNEKHDSTGKMGVSPIFYTSVSTIPAIQGLTQYNASRFSQNQLTFNAQIGGRNLTLGARKNKEMIVIAVMEGGFYLQEVDKNYDDKNYDDEKDVCDNDAKYACDYSSIYMYTYSTPYVDDNREKNKENNEEENEENTFLPVGALVKSANGSVYEFFGFTEISFPTFKPYYNNNEFIIRKLPNPKNITKCLYDPAANNNNSNDNKLEACEASLVKVKNVTVEWFDKNDTSYSEYSQFRLKTSEGKIITAQTVYTAPLFNPIAEMPSKPDGTARHHYNFTGILKQHTSADPSWIIVPRSMDDIECLDCEDE